MSCLQFVLLTDGLECTIKLFCTKVRSQPLCVYHFPVKFQLTGITEYTVKKKKGDSSTFFKLTVCLSFLSIYNMRYYYV